MSYAAAGLGRGITEATSIISQALQSIDERHLAQQERERLALERQQKQADDDAKQGITRGYSPTVAETPDLTPRSGATMFQGAKLGGLGDKYQVAANPTPLAPPAVPVPSVMAGERIGMAGPAGKLQGLPGVGAPRADLMGPAVPPVVGVQFGGPSVERDVTKGTDFQAQLALHKAQLVQAQQDKDAQAQIDAPERAELIAHLKDPALIAVAATMDMPALRALIVKLNTPDFVVMPQMGGGAVSIDKNDPQAGATPIPGAAPFHVTPKGPANGPGGGATGAAAANAAMSAKIMAHANAELTGTFDNNGNYTPGMDASLASELVASQQRMSIAGEKGGLMGAVEGGVGDLLRGAQSPDQQQAATAMDEFIDSVAQHITGSKRVSDQLRANIKRIVSPLPGEKDPRVIAAKAVRRAKLLEAVGGGKYAGTPGANGEADEANAMAVLQEIESEVPVGATPAPPAGLGVTPAPGDRPAAETPGQRIRRLKQERDAANGR